MRFSIRLDAVWRAPLLLIGVRRRDAWVELTEQALILQFGVFHEEIPLTELHGAERIDWPLWYGIGVRLAPRNTIGFVGSRHGVVAVRLRGPRRFRVPFPVQRERLAVSLHQPDAFVEAVNRAAAAQKGW